MSISASSQLVPTTVSVPATASAESISARPWPRFPKSVTSAHWFAAGVVGPSSAADSRSMPRPPLSVIWLMPIPLSLFSLEPLRRRRMPSPLLNAMALAFSGRRSPMTWFFASWAVVARM